MTEMLNSVEKIAYGRSSVLGWAMTQEPYARMLREIIFSSNENTHMNACARMDEETSRRLVELNAGCVQELGELIVHATLFPAVLDVLMAKKIGEARLRGLILGAAIDFITWHEIQHHGLGHVGYFCEPGDPGFHERSQFSQIIDEGSDSWKRTTSLDFRACEISADGQAASFIWRHQKFLRSDPECRYYGLGRKAMLRILSFATTVAFACIASGEVGLASYERFTNDEGDYDDQVYNRSYRYPHPSVRLMHVDAHLERSCRLWWLYGDRRETNKMLGVVARLGKTEALSFSVFEPIVDETSVIQLSAREVELHWLDISEKVESYGVWKSHVAV